MDYNRPKIHHFKFYVKLCLKKYTKSFEIISSPAYTIEVKKINNIDIFHFKLIYLEDFLLQKKINVQN